MKAPLKVAFLWHMHQPYYKNIETGKFIMPWVRMHAVKDYYDMVSVLDNYEGIKQTFNLVPSLLLQLEEYIQGTTDIFMDMSRKHPSDLNEDEKIFILFNFFMANWETMVFPHDRFASILRKRGENSHPDELKKTHRLFSNQEILDLQTWFNLCWIDPVFHKIFPDILEIKEKGENFTEEEKQQVLNRHMDIMKMVVPKYKKSWQEGKIEVSTTPFYHPILPLVTDCSVAKQCMPKMPPLDFEFSHPEDAYAQIKKGLDYFEKTFGKRPKGMWPSEGSVSEPVMNMLAQNGVKWAATDQEILFKSMWLSGEEHDYTRIYKPHTINTQSGNVDMFFRNLHLSDLVGFQYQRWNENDAADNFMHELHKIRESLPEGEHCVNVILDGENAWEYYRNDGHDFLHALYSRMEKSADIKTVTMSEAAESFGQKPAIKKLWPGSWINHDFYIWIGHEDDRRAWKLLKKTRDDLVEWEKNNAHESKKLAKAWESLYIAEGSDWNWWYGDVHSSKNDAEFDNLYRMHLMNVYVETGMKVPDELYVPIEKHVGMFEVLPVKPVSPVIDGMNTHFYEWKGAGYFDLKKEGGAMHKADKTYDSMQYGFDSRNFCLRLDSSEKAFLKPGTGIEVHFKGREKEAKVVFSLPECRVSAEGVDSSDGIACAAKDIFEAVVPLASLAGLNPADELKFTVSVVSGGNTVEKIPEKGSVRFLPDEENLKLFNWKV